MTERKNVPLVSLVEGYEAHAPEINAALQRVLKSGWYILGQEVSAFEGEFARWCDTSHCIGVANGTDAIVIALRALGVGDGDAVFTVSHTAVATVAAIDITGASPVLVDIDERSFTLDPAKLEEAIIGYAGGARPKAVIAVHLYGQACDLEAIQAICRRHGLYLIEDCAQAHGTRYKDRPVGGFGNMATFSFYPTKNLGAFGDGGAVVTSDDRLAAAARALRQYGWHERYLSDVPGMNSRLDELHAAVLRVRLAHLDAEIAVRRRIAAAYDAALAGQVTTPWVRPLTSHSYHLYVIRVSDRDRFAAALKRQGIDTGIHYPQAVHQQKAYAGRVATAGDLAITNRIYCDIVSLPMFPFLSDADVARVIATVSASVVGMREEAHDT
ncbi:MAG TPA: DegT/DnrJ/EryC1/StrS family aminotransferase [Rhizomicrobium sp.]|nr:DegT/DnrJ/EryC1/StrS family aminotransferase [Rhizomicrobium sp.]